MSSWRRYHFTGTPGQLHRPSVRLDNLALVPASLLPFRAQYQALANTLAEEEVLIILPTSVSQRRVLDTVADFLRQKGHGVTLLSAEEYSR